MSNLGKLFADEGPHSAKELRKLQKKGKDKGKDKGKWKPAPPKKDKPKKDKPTKPNRGEAWMKAGKAVTAQAEKWSAAESEERGKTQSLKDQLYIRRSKRRT
tara:strand:+ start:725 stop:1030 length:306 start_codon:yes stop_codon:yes gene_type:complete